jgi:hypothetical protein
VAFEILHGALVLFGRLESRKGSQVPAFAGLWVRFSGIKAILAGCQFADHGDIPWKSLVSQVHKAATGMPSLAKLTTT